MAKHVSIIYFGSEHDEHGLPKPFHRYEVYSSKWDEGGIATVVTTTEGSQSPRQRSFVSSDGRKRAVKLAEEAIAFLHPGLERHRG